MKDISKRFPGVQALDKVSFELKQGEVHALIGENGSGKSTLMKTLIGLYHADAGQIFLKGEEVFFRNPADALKHRISMIHQEICLVPTLSVAENIWLGREEKFTQGGIINKKQRDKLTQNLLHELNMDLDPNTIVKSISVANMQLVEIARAISCEAEIIIMDEPTSALAEKEIEVLYKIVNKLKNSGVTIVFISHKLEEIFNICDRVTILRDGKYIGTKLCSEIDLEHLVHMIVGYELSELFPKEQIEIGDVILEVKGISDGKVLNDVSFNLRKGEILGVWGLMGAGRTEIMRTIFGIDKAKSKTGGTILLHGKRVRINSPSHAIKVGFGMVTEDRLHTGIFANMSVLKNITLCKLSSFMKFGLLSKKIEMEQGTNAAKNYNVKAGSMNQPIGSLSGGNQQKVILARWLMLKPDILILDEPTRGIDVGSKSEIHKQIGQLVKEGISIILVSSEMPEVLGISDRILVIREGRVAAEYDTKIATKEQLIKSAFGV
ncbi:MAG: sugar ABC transporter ATP-binding protein [Prevotella sp.]|nr:sugar ABC transporter ATP-binding protein [Prevotella sp.]